MNLFNVVHHLVLLEAPVTTVLAAPQQDVEVAQDVHVHEELLGPLRLADHALHAVAVVLVQAPDLLVQGARPDDHHAILEKKIINIMRIFLFRVLALLRVGEFIPAPLVMVLRGECGFCWF